MPDSLAVDVERLGRVYKLRGRKNSGTLTALADIDLQVRRGELFGLLGPNGAGKTTLMKILTTLLAPTSGRAHVAGYDVSREPHAVRPRINMVAGGESSGYMASISASSAGAIAYSGGSIRPSQLTWFDRGGQPLQTVGPADLTAVANIGMSPDGRQVALSRVVAGNWDIWLTDMQGVASRFTSGRELDFNPVWLPDGKRIVFQSNNDFRIRSVNDGAAEQVVLKAAREMQYPSDVSPDGRQLLYTRSTTTAAGSSVGLWYLQLTGDPMPRPFAASAFDERDGQFSPDGRAVAYQSNESGRYEVYIQPFPGPDERVKVSAGGGQQVRWARQTGALFYIASDQRLTSVPVTIGANGAIATGQPAPLFRIVFDNGGFQARQQYVVSPDSQRFLINNPTGPVDPSSISVVLNWAGKP